MTSNNPTLLTCPTCNAPLDYDGVHSVIRCKFCGNNSVVPASMMPDSSASPNAWEEIRQLVNNGDMDAAINRFGSYFSSDANKSRDAINLIAGGRVVTSSMSSSHSVSELTEIMELVQQLVSKGQREKAIELFKLTFNKDQEHAENSIDEIATWNEIQQPPVLLESPIIPSPGKKKSPACVLIAILSIVILIGGVVALILTGAFTPHYYSYQSAILLPPINGQDALIAGTFYNPNADTRFIGLVQTSSGKMLWKSDPLEETTASLEGNADLIYAADGPHLKSLHIGDGSLAWQTEMSDALRYGHEIMLVTAGRVITMTLDQKITAYDAASGSQAWSLEQSVYDSTLRLSGGSLLVLDYLPGSYDQSLFFLNPITGKQQAVISPTCEMNNSEYGMSSDTGIVLDQAENTLFFVFTEGCVQRFNLSSKQLVWNTFDQATFNFLYAGFSSLLSDHYLYFGNGGALVRIDKSSGDEKILVSDPDYMLVPLAISGDNLILQAKKTRGTAQFEIWGVSADSGTITWQRTMKNADPIDPPDEMTGLIDDTDWGWSWHMSDAGMTLLTFSGEPNQVVVETLNPADGISPDKQIIPLKKISGDFYSIPSIIGWRGSVSYLDIEGSFYSLDPVTMKLELIY